MLNPALIRYKENTMKRICNIMIPNTKETLLNIAAKEATKTILSSFYVGVVDIFKQGVNSGAVDNVISARLDNGTKSQKFVQMVGGCLMKTPAITAPITKLVKRHAEIVAMNEAKIYDPTTNEGNEDEEGTRPSPLTGRYPAPSASSKHDE